MPVWNNDFCTERAFSAWCSKRPKNTLGQEFENTALSSGTWWNTAAESLDPTNYVGWREPMILFSTPQTQTSPWRFDQSLMKIKSHKKLVISECFWRLHGEKYAENITSYGVFAGVVSLGRPWLFSWTRKKTVCSGRRDTVRDLGGAVGVSAIQTASHGGNCYGTKVVISLRALLPTEQPHTHLSHVY